MFISAPAIQMCFHCTRSSTCGTRCCWVTPLSPSVSAWPYCSSSGTVSWPTASMSASYSSLTCQVRICTGIYIFVNTMSSVCPSFQVYSILRLGQVLLDNKQQPKSIFYYLLSAHVKPLYLCSLYTNENPTNTFFCLPKTSLKGCPSVWATGICRRLFSHSSDTFANACWCVLS